MEEITKLFNNPKFGVLEVVLIDGKEHFPAIDCAEMLGYVNPRDAIAKHCKTPGVAIRDVGGRNRNQSRWHSCGAVCQEEIHNRRQPLPAHHAQQASGSGKV